MSMEKAREAVEGWVELSALTGKHVDTIRKLRNLVGDKTYPWWRSEEAALDWFEGLIARAQPAPAAPPQPRKPRAPQPELGAAVDPREVARELARSAK
jgi:hypothetical protein